MTAPFVGNRGPRDRCPRCGGRAWMEPSSQVMKCMGAIIGWREVPEGRRPLYGLPCGWSQPYAPGCCGDGPNRWQGGA